MEDLESGIVELQGLADSTGNREHIEALKTKKIALKDLLSTKAQGALVRSRFQSINEMDAPTSFFFGLEKKQNQSRSIHSLLSDDGQELTEPSQIRKRAVDFYSALYRSEYKEHEKYAVFCDNLPQVSIRSNANLGKPLSLQELHSALMNMQGGKAPGIDGLTVEFYKAFWDVIGEDLMAVLNESLAVGLLPLSCRRAVITLLPKKGNLQDIKNWRPVSLLCTEYKILSKALANRVKGVMDQVIHQDQTYCVPGRSIRDNVHLIRDVLDLSSSLGLDVGLISMDQEKAFDRVEHQYLWKVMESFGFNADLIAMIKVLYQDIESVLKFNGGLCAPFKVQRGVRQGCGCSAMLYAISIEPFLQRVRRHIKGFLLPGCTESVVLAAYADDVIIMTRDQADVDTLRTITEDFCAVSAAKARMVDFFWDRLHWVPQCVLFLPREEGGQGLVHLASRAATFRLQFIQRYLTGPPDVVWRGVTSCVLRLADPLVHGSRLDIQDSATPGLATMLIRRGTLVLKQLVDVAGPALDNAEAVGRQLGVTSGRYCGKLLDLWKKRLTETERRLLGEYSSGSLMPDPRDAFPDISLVPEMESYTGPLIHTRQQRLRDAHRKTLLTREERMGRKMLMVAALLATSVTVVTIRQAMKTVARTGSRNHIRPEPHQTRTTSDQDHIRPEPHQTRTTSDQDHIRPEPHQTRTTSDQDHIRPEPHQTRTTSDQDHIRPEPHQTRTTSDQNHIRPEPHQTRTTSDQDHIRPGPHQTRTTSDQNHIRLGQTQTS
ncbi:Transposon TX1 uncharacterized protein [Merluccius polli]|uniref:Transposon TX1 uncharacterized protein n=1 Tax=Merluccius polli TaxID=89951 RepID=A0AA47MKL8_MERPO|nr:Transposon TX1 uncharacterized protein [Merluccius polli]